DKARAAAEFGLLVLQERVDDARNELVTFLSRTVGQHDTEDRDRGRVQAHEHAGVTTCDPFRGPIRRAWDRAACGAAWFVEGTRHHDVSALVPGGLDEDVDGCHDVVLHTCLNKIEIGATSAVAREYVNDIGTRLLE